MQCLLGAGREVECCEGPVVDGVLGHDVVDGGGPRAAEHVDRPREIHLDADVAAVEVPVRAPGRVLARGHRGVVAADVGGEVLGRHGQQRHGPGVRGEVLHILQRVEHLLPHQGRAQGGGGQDEGAGGGRAQLLRLGRGVGGEGELVIFLLVVNRE